MFGSHRIAPDLSPNKTIEGLVGGFLIGTMAFWFAGLYQDWLSGVDALIIGAAVAAVAPLGDLFASMVKRDLGPQDTGRPLRPPRRPRAPPPRPSPPRGPAPPPAAGPPVPSPPPTAACSTASTPSSSRSSSATT